MTLLPSLDNGVVVYEDSPLVKAMTHGRVLMIDEFDKAPTEVVCILKGLLEDGEVLLSDGRRFISNKSTLARHAPQHTTTAVASNVHHIHPEFLVIALANRPGYPFLGNDFYREMGDVFACHVVDNPDLQSEIALLRGYGPNVDVGCVLVLVALGDAVCDQVVSTSFQHPLTVSCIVSCGFRTVSWTFLHSTVRL